MYPAKIDEGERQIRDVRETFQRMQNYDLTWELGSLDILQRRYTEGSQTRTSTSVDLDHLFPSSHSWFISTVQWQRMLTIFLVSIKYIDEAHLAPRVHLCSKHLRSEDTHPHLLCDSSLSFKA